MRGQVEASMQMIDRFFHALVRGRLRRLIVAMGVLLQHQMEPKL